MKLTRKAFVSLACRGDERIIAKHAPQAVIQHVERFPTQEERQFVFRCFWVPYEMIGACEKAFSLADGRAWYVGVFALVFAHSRTLKEMCAWRQNPVDGWWERKKAPRACEWWMERYDSYLRAVDDSFRHWIRRKCSDCSHDQPNLATASRFGFLQRADVAGLPSAVLSRLMAEWKRREQKDSRESEFFHTNANPKGTKEPRWDHPDFDLWLIEVWPLVAQYGWTYKDTYDLALKKFGDDDAFDELAALRSPAQLKERCELLGLRLSNAAQQRSGRPKKHDDANGLSRFSGTVFQSFAIRARRMDEETRAQGPTAFLKLAESAVNIEPFTRLLNNQTKESFVFAPADQLRSPPV